MRKFAIEARDIKKTYITTRGVFRGEHVERTALQGAGLLAGELAVGLVYAAIGCTLFIWLENRARRGGLQEAY